jgi:hypothetical protein
MVRTGQQLPLLQLMENFVAGKHSLFPIPQSFITQTNGLSTQNPGY